MATPTAPAQAADNDTLASLEERVLRAVQLVNQLRQEKESAIAEKDVAIKAASELQEQNAQLSEELDTLKSERKQVRTRIEKLLGQMDILAS